MNREEKILQTLKEEKVFGISETDRYSYYICKGVSNKVYDVVFFKGLERYKCNCGNIRNTECYHIEAVKRLEEYENSQDDSLFSGNSVDNSDSFNLNS